MIYLGGGGLLIIEGTYLCALFVLTTKISFSNVTPVFMIMLIGWQIGSWVILKRYKIVLNPLLVKAQVDNSICDWNGKFICSGVTL